jgi:4-diphosphocytidyl-2-C-methyl-D-erythritol kinase
MNLNSLKALCPAKINITLDVIGKREDGYHNVVMVMQAISLFDEVIVTKTNKKNIEIKTNLHYVPTDERNVAFKAAKVFFEKTGLKNEGIHIKINKKIPVAAGLAGGSTNAAGVLIALNSLYDVKLSNEKLAEIGLMVGADVPFCLMGGTALAEGLGEILTPLKEMPKCFFVLAKPKQSVSTPEVYREIDKKQIAEHPDTNGVIECLKEKDLNGIAKRLFNVMEVVSVKICPDIEKLKSTILDFSPLGVVMSGSGPTVFGIFDDEQKANACFHQCKLLTNEAFVCEPIKDGIIIA